VSAFVIDSVANCPVLLGAGTLSMFRDSTLVVKIKEHHRIRASLVPVRIVRVCGARPRLLCVINISHDGTPSNNVLVCTLPLYRSINQIFSMATWLNGRASVFETEGCGFESRRG
jgi:hypothetical protein